MPPTDAARKLRFVLLERSLLPVVIPAAHVSLVTLSARCGITFNSWDRARLPLPFATLQLSVRVLPPPVEGDYQAALAAAQSAYADTAGASRSPASANCPGIKT